MSVTFWIPEYKGEDVPELNVTNANAALLLGTLGIYNKDLVGEIPSEELPTYIRKTVEICNSKSARIWTREPSDNGRFVDFGADSDYVIRKMQHLQTLFMFARERNLSVTYS